MSTAGRRKVSTTIYIEAEQSEALKLLHERSKIPMAEFIRQGLDMVIEVYRPLLVGTPAEATDRRAPAMIAGAVDGAEVRGRREEVIANARERAAPPVPEEDLGG